MAHHWNNPLHLWCRKGFYTQVNQFIRTCKDLPSHLAHHQGVHGYTPLHEAAIGGHSDILDLLLQYGGDVNCLTYTSSSTPLHLAAFGHHKSCIMLLLAYGADDTLIDNDNKTPLQMTRLTGNDFRKLQNSAEFIIAMKSDIPYPSEILNTRSDDLEENTINYALLAAVLSHNHVNIKKIVDIALEESRRMQSYGLTATLLLIKAAIEDDQILVRKLYNEDVQGLPTKIPLTEEDDLIKLQQYIYGVDTLLPIELARQTGASAVREELLLKIGIHKNSKTVSWPHLNLIELEISWFQKLYWVEVLKLAHNMLRFLPLDMGRYLKWCTDLDLQQNLLSVIPPCLFELPNIVDLNLSCNNISAIPEVPEWSASLSTLNLSHNQLSSLPDSVFAPFLKNLNISHNQFMTVPHCVCSFTGLTTLNIAYNFGIRTLPVELGRIKNLLILHLDGLDDLDYPPQNFCSTMDDCIIYLQNQFYNYQAYYHMKIIVLGKRGTGKSTLVARIVGKQVDNKSSCSLNVAKWKYTSTMSKKTFHFTIWDFVGHEEHHQIFMSMQSLYLLVWDISEEDGGITGLKSWFNVISTRATKCNVIVVGTFLDKATEIRHQAGKVDGLLKKVRDLTRLYKHLVVTHIIPVGKMGNVIKLKDYICEASEYIINKRSVMGAMVPSSYLTLVGKLASIRQKIKENIHKPIMHAVEFKKMVRDLNLVDIQDDEEIREVTQFLHEDGALLHYDDWRNNLDDLYFVDPQWLCDILFTFVTVIKRNNFVNHGIVRRKEIPDLLWDKNFQNQILSLLNRYEISLPLDTDYSRVLFPSMLPRNYPPKLSQLRKGGDCFRRYITFQPRGPSFCHATPPGLWSHLLSRLMNNIKEVKKILDEQIPVEENGDLGACEINDYSYLEREMVSANCYKFLGYWKTGLCCITKNSYFIVESLAENPQHNNKDGISIVSSKTAEGQKVFCDLIDIVKQLVSEWLPELDKELIHFTPCYKCIKAGGGCEFKIFQLISDLIEDQKLTTRCGASHQMQIADLVPDLFLVDVDPEFKIDEKEIIKSELKSYALGIGVSVYKGTGRYKGRLVSIIDPIALQEWFRLECKVLQQLHHPNLVNMVGATMPPRMLLLLEEIPLGMLQSVMIEQHLFSRIFCYRIAVQVASALQYLHNINIIHCNLNSRNVLMWSLSPDHLINCKVTDFCLATHVYPGGSRGHQSNKNFGAPEIAYLNQHSVHNFKADIFDFGKIIYNLIAHCDPFYGVKLSTIKTILKRGQRPLLGDGNSLFYISHIMQLCWASNPNDRPTAQEIIEWLSAPALQLIMSVIPIEGKYSISNGCIVAPAAGVPISSELWICCEAVEGFDLNIFHTSTMKYIKEKLIDKKIQVQFIKQCGEHIWVTSTHILEGEVVDIFNCNTKDLVYTISLRGATVSCITNSNQLVYMGTEEGYCLAYSMDIQSIGCDNITIYKHISDHCIDGIVLTNSHLWVSTSNQVNFLNHESLNLEGFLQRPMNTDALVGKMMLSDDEDQVWSAHLGGVIMSSWDAHQHVHLCDVDVGVVAEEKCHVGDPRDQIITAMCTGLDTVWIGLASGHIIVFGMNPPGEVLTYFRPYHSYVRFLSAANYPGPRGNEECMMLSGGKVYQPEDSFKELPDYPRQDKMGQPVDSAGVAVLWEVIQAKYVRQLHYLRDGKAWSSYDTLIKAMIDTGFTESLKYCHPPPVSSSAATIPHNDTPDKDHQQDVKEEHDTTLHDVTTYTDDNVSSQSELLCS